MAYFREFYLTNGNNEKCDLSNKNYKRFLSSPSGLGFSKTVENRLIGNSYNVISEVVDFPIISGTILFYGELEENYQEYFNFIRFLSFAPISLYYLPPNTLYPYFINCIITNLEKTEANEFGALECDIEFTGTSFWKKSNINHYTFENKYATLNGKHYELARPYFYEQKSLNNMEIINDGMTNVGFTFEIFGDCENPKFVISQNQNRYGICSIIGNYDYVKINSNDNDEIIYLEKNGLPIENAFSYQDLTETDMYTTFIKLKPGKNIISFSCDNIDTFNGHIDITYLSEFYSV